MSKALIIGYGSIGRRHASILRSLGCDVALVTQQTVADFQVYKQLPSALSSYQPGYVIVSNPTADHANTIEELAARGFNGRLLIEKPIKLDAGPVAENNFEFAAVGYNLRFHPVLRALQARLLSDAPLAISVSCGQHLSTWRPDREYQNTYSAFNERGGGVLRDLSHELDYMQWLAGRGIRVSAIGGNYGVLGIDADEAWSILLELESGVKACVELDYFSRPARREIRVVTRSAIYKADMIGNVLTIDGRDELFDVRKDDTYRAMHQAMLGGPDTAALCSIEEGLQTVTLMNAIETANKSKQWKNV